MCVRTKAFTNHNTYIFSCFILITSQVDYNLFLKSRTLKEWIGNMFCFFISYTRHFGSNIVQLLGNLLWSIHLVHAFEKCQYFENFRISQWNLSKLSFQMEHSIQRKQATFRNDKSHASRSFTVQLKTWPHFWKLICIYFKSDSSLSESS